MSLYNLKHGTNLRHTIVIK